MEKAVHDRGIDRERCRTEEMFSWGFLMETHCDESQASISWLIMLLTIYKSLSPDSAQDYCIIVLHILSPQKGSKEAEICVIDVNRLKGNQESMEWWHKWWQNVFCNVCVCVWFEICFSHLDICRNLSSNGFEVWFIWEQMVVGTWKCISKLKHEVQRSTLTAFSAD